MVDASASTCLPVWLDCDPGHDDALALILAAHSPAVRLLGVSTCHGNQTLAKTTLNARRVLAMAGVAHIPVIPGAAKPLLRPARVCAEIHGASGLDGPDVAEHACCDAHHAPPAGDRAVTRMHAALWAAHEACGRATLVCTGALTNAALLLSIYPELVDVLRIVLMGGAMGAGNTGAVAEFNIQLDPESAAIVFNSGAAVTMVPLEVTHQALVTPEVLARVRGSDASATRFRRVVGELLVYFAASYKRVFNFEAPPLHDPCAVACAFAPHLFTLRRMRVDVETCSPLSSGQTVCDVWGQSPLPPNVTVATAMDVPAFWELTLAALASADACSPMNVA
jgi:inosine-uridine nucleoside N-ribohydrolase